MTNWSRQTSLFIGIALSLVLHGLSMALLRQRSIAGRASEAIKVRVVEIPPEPKPEVLPAKPLQKPEPKPPVKRREKPVATERQPPQVQPAEPVAPVQGLSQESVDPSGKGAVAVPLGNTLMTADEGKRLEQAPAPMTADLSSDPQLVRDSVVTPQYTDAALDANFEGFVVVEVLVDETGKVVEAQVAKKIGYGMDQRILAAASAARFIPRKNRLGRSEAGWTEIRFNLQIP